MEHGWFFCDGRADRVCLCQGLLVFCLSVIVGCAGNGVCFNEDAESFEIEFGQCCLRFSCLELRFFG